MSKRKTSNIVHSKNDLAPKIIVVLIVLIIICGSGVGYMYYNRYMEMKSAVEIDAIYNNIFIENVNISGLSKEQAIERVTAELLDPMQQRQIVLRNGSDNYPYTFKQFDAVYAVENAVNEAYNYAREGSISERYELIIKLQNEGKYISPAYSYDMTMVSSELEALKEKVYKAPVNASVERKNGEFVTTEGKNGIEMDTERTASAIEELLKQKIEGEVIIATNEIKPQYNAASFAKLDDVIGSFSTRYTGGDNARITNMKVAASRIDGTVLYPGETFSTNACFGESTAANGYLPAPTIVDGKLVDDYGGGVCQVSSTLYNAVLYSELEVVERQNHSLKVGYADYGYDATLAGDYIDLKFKNSTDTPIYLESYLTSNQVVCKVYGNEERASSRSIKFENELVETIKHGEDKIVYDAALDEGTRKTTVKALNGYKYKLYKLIYENGTLVDKIQVNNSYYKPRNAEITVGTKKVDVQASATTDTPAANETQEQNQQETQSDVQSDEQNGNEQPVI